MKLSSRLSAAVAVWLATGVALIAGAAYAAPLAYLPSGDTSVQVVDAATGTPGVTIAVGHGAIATAATPDGTRVYVVCQGDQTIEIIDTATNTLIGAPIALGTTPFGIVVTPDGSKVYVNGNNGVSVIDTATRALSVIPVSVAVALAISPDGTKLYVSNFDGLRTYSTADSQQIGGVIADGFNAHRALAVSPDGSLVYLSNDGDAASIISTATGAVTGQIPLGELPLAMVISKDGAKLYATNNATNTVSVSSTVSRSLIGTISVGAFPMGEAITPDGSKLYVVDANAHGISVIDTTDDQVSAFIPLNVSNGFGYFFSPGPGGATPAPTGVVYTLSSGLMPLQGTHRAANCAPVGGCTDYTAASRITGTMTIFGSLTPNQPSMGIFPSAFSFSDGINTYTSGDPALRATIIVSTDAAGQINGVFDIGLQRWRDGKVGGHSAGPFDTTNIAQRYDEIDLFGPSESAINNFPCLTYRSEDDLCLQSQNDSFSSFADGTTANTFSTAPAPSPNNPPITCTADHRCPEIGIPAVPVPTLSPLVMLLLASALGGGGVLMTRRRRWV